jgi:hypothetical protein
MRLILSARARLEWVVLLVEDPALTARGATLSATDLEEDTAAIRSWTESESIDLTDAHEQSDDLKRN